MKIRPLKTKRLLFATQPNFIVQQDNGDHNRQLMI